MNDRRTAQRIPVHLTAHYDSAAVSMDAWVANLSRGGAFLRAELLDDPGSRVDVSIALPSGGAPVVARGEVVRVDERPLSAGMAIRFTEIAPSAASRLANFVIEQAYQESPRG